jgi:hypothetical protein
VEGASIWAGDGIHLTPSSSRVAARKLMADVAHGGLDDEPAAKRIRLELVVPAPAPARKKEAAQGQQARPPPPQPCPPFLWLSSQLPPTQRVCGAGNYSSSHNGRGPAGGSSRGGNRSAGRGNRGPLRGGHRSSWGHW